MHVYGIIPSFHLGTIMSIIYVIPGVLTLLYIVTPLFPTDILFYMVIHHILSGVQPNLTIPTILNC